MPLCEKGTDPKSQHVCEKGTDPQNLNPTTACPGNRPMPPCEKGTDPKPDPGHSLSDNRSMPTFEKGTDPQNPIPATACQATDPRPSDKAVNNLEKIVNEISPKTLTAQLRSLECVDVSASQ
jgi:hypothetical protein